MRAIRKLRALIVAMISVCLSQAQAIELVKKDDVSFNLGGRFQLLGVAEHVTDPGHTEDRLYLFLKQARMIASGTLDDYKFYTEWAMGGEEAVKNLNASVSLLDFWADLPLGEHTYVRLGQFKAPFGREALTDDGSLLFTDRSINYFGSFLGRDVGFAGVVQKKGLMGTLGVFTGGGRDNPERFLPERIGIPLLAARIGYDSRGLDPYYYKNSGVFSTDEKAFASFLNLAYMKDTVIGHSTVLNVKPTERSILLNPNWNPYLTQTPFTRSQLWEISTDTQFRAPVGDFSGTGEFELNHAEFSNEYGTIPLSGGRIQGTVALNPFEMSLRYAVLFPSSEFKYKGVPITGDTPFQELTPSIIFYHRPWSRFTLEVPLQINTPVAVEDGAGSYVLVEQQDQTTFINGRGHMERQFVPEIRLMYQLAF